jgi:hypothetical protein
MALEKPRSRGRFIESSFLAITGIVLAFLFFHLLEVHRKDFTDVDKRLADGTMINLTDPGAADHMAALLRKGYYFEDPKDIALIQAAVSRGMADGREQIDNIGELNKSKYNVLADDAFDKGGITFKKRVLNARSSLAIQVLILSGSIRKERIPKS